MQDVADSMWAAQPPRELMKHLCGLLLVSQGLLHVGRAGTVWAIEISTWVAIASVWDACTSCGMFHPLCSLS